MRVLFVTAYYPPCQYGWGYMRVCEQIADGLENLGHDVTILTSSYKDGEEIKSYPIHRLLPIDPDWNSRIPGFIQFSLLRKRRERRSIQHFLKLIESFQPDVVFIWHAHGLSREMLKIAENLREVKTVYYFANYLPEMPDEYIEYWKGVPETRIVRRIKTPLSRAALDLLSEEDKPIRLKYEHSISVSEYVRERLISQNLIGDDAVIIPNGVDLDEFNANGRKTEVDLKKIKLLMAGRLAPEKGVHTVVESLRILHQKNDLKGMKLTVLGSGRQEYQVLLRQMVSEHHLQRFVEFKQPVPVSEMPIVYDNFDILLLPSEWNEPLACVMLEAMAEGLLVVGTNTGGSGEVLVDGHTGLTFEPGNAESLAGQLSNMRSNPELIRHLAQAGHNQVYEKFNIKDTILKIEQYLLDLIP